MYRFTLIIIFLTLVTTSFVYSQQPDSSNINKTDTSELAPPDTTDEFDYFFTEEEEKKYLSFKPILGIGAGAISYFGDVRDTYNKDIINGRMAANVSVTKGFRSFLDVKFNLLYGNITGNERSAERNLNFKTEFLSAAAMISYNFEHLLKKDWLLIPYKEQRRLIPYISIGIETFSFNSKVDMMDANNNYYHYWSDGTIRNVSENVGTETNSIIIKRDYNYETDLRELDNDGLGKYGLTAFTLPIDACIEYQIHERVQLQLGLTYHYNFNDLIDDVSNAGSGVRNGKKSGDSFLYTYFTFKLDIFSSEKEIQDSILYDVDQIDYDGIVLADKDGDGVNDLNDLAPGTPKGVEIDSLGRPLDIDYDGIPDFRDKEKESAKGAMVNTDGVTMTEAEMIAMSKTPPAINADEICTYYPSMCGKTWKSRKFAEIPAKFEHIDTNTDGYISIDELNLEIDKFFDFESDLNVEDIYELSDFFFEQ